MASIARTIFETSVFLLSSNRDEETEKKLMKNVDVLDQKFCELIISEIEEIRRKLNGHSRNHLHTSFASFIAGLRYVYQLLGLRTVPDIDYDAPLAEEAVTLKVDEVEPNPYLSSTSEVVSIVPESVSTASVELSNSTNQLLSNAEKSFRDVGEKATEAFRNESLSTADKLLAMKLRLSAAIFKHVTNVNGVVLEECKTYLNELHDMSAVREAFTVQFKMNKGLKSWFKKREREQIIVGVCRINRYVYFVVDIINKGKGDLFIWPSVDIGEEKLDPLHDARVAEVLRKLKMEHCFVPRSYLHPHRPIIYDVTDISINKRGHFIVVYDQNVLQDVLVLNSEGQYLYTLNPPPDSVAPELYFSPISVATDQDDNIYVLVKLREWQAVRWIGVYVFDQYAKLLRRFPLREMFYGDSLVAKSNEVLVLGRDSGGYIVDVYSTDGQYIRSVGENILNFARVMTVSDGRILVLDNEPMCVQAFSAEGELLHQFPIHGGIDSDLSNGGIAFHKESGHIIVCFRNLDTEYRGQVSIYSEKGEFVHSFRLDTDRNPDAESFHPIIHVAVLTANGRLVVGCDGKILLV